MKLIIKACCLLNINDHKKARNKYFNDINVIKSKVHPAGFEPASPNWQSGIIALQEHDYKYHNKLNQYKKKHEKSAPSGDFAFFETIQASNPGH